MLRFFIFLLVFIMELNLQAQDFPMRKFTTQEGLVNNNITCLYQDSRGYLWIGTEAGISRFNGEEFKNYNLKNGLPDQQINAIIEDRRGDIWVLASKGLACFDGTTWFKYPCKNFCEFIGECKMGFDPTGDLHVNNNGQLFELKDEKLQLSTQFKNKLLDTLPVQYHYDKLENKWLVIQGNKLLVFRDSTIVDTFPIVAPLSKNDKIEFLDFYGHTFITHSYNGIKEYFVFHDNKLKLLADIRQGNPRILMAFHHPYIISGGGGIFRYNHELNQLVQLYQNPEPDITEDYIISYRKDFFFVDNDAFYQFFGETFKNYEGVINTWMLALGQNDTIFAGGYFPSKLYKVKDDYTQEIALNSLYDDINKQLNKKLNHYSFYPGGSFIDNVGYFPFSEGVMEYKSGQLKPIFSKPAGPTLMTHADRLRKVVVCGVTNGIMIIKDGSVIETLGQKDGIHSNKYIISIAQDKKNRYWLGSNNGLTCYDYESRKVIYNFTNASHPDQIKGGVVSMTHDNQGRLWLGTASGLCILDEKNDSLISVTRNEMPIYCSSLTHTEDGYLLIGNPEGLYQFDYKTYFQKGIIRYKIFNQASGFLGEDTVNSIVRDSSGNIWIGCIDNLVKFRPQIDPFVSLELKPVIQNVNGINIGFNPSISDPIVITDNKISIVYEAVGHYRPSITEFAYKLEGLDKDWKNWTTFRYSLYENLPNGEYTFSVKAKSMMAGWSELPIASIPIRISAPFKNWPTFPYYVAIFFTLILFAIVFLISLYRRAASRQIRLEKEARFLRVQALQAQMNPHFVFNVLASVQNLVMKNDTKLAGQYLAEFGTMIRQFLNASVAGNSFDEYDTNQTIPLKEEISLINTFVHLEQFNYPDRFEYFLELEDDFNLENYSIPPMIVQPFVENAIKYGLLYSGSSNGRLHLTVRKISEFGFEINISDNGVGRAAAKVFQSKSVKTYKSLGGDLAHERIRILNQMGHKINLEIKDNPDGGTIVILTFYELQ
jgi:ligand-binding sensor domain-containing protein